MQRLTLLLLCYIFVVTGAHAQNWEPVSITEFDSPKLDYLDQPVILNLEDIQAYWAIAATAPAEASQGRSDLPRIKLPNIDGSMGRFLIESSPVMHPGLAAKFPEIQSFRVYHQENPKISGRMALSPFGLNAHIITPEGSYYIEPATDQLTNTYLVYQDKQVINVPAQTLSCGYTGGLTSSKTFSLKKQTTHQHTHTHAPQRGMGDLIDLRVYDLALACTGEFAERFDATQVSDVMARFNTAMNIANTVFESEVGVRMMLIENNDQLVFLNPTTDPYINADQGGALLGQNTAAIVEVGGIPFSSFDLGHVFTSGCTDVGGVVSGNACTNGKARGVTCFSSNSISSIVNRIFVHEVAHQFDVDHSWNNCPGIQEQRRSASAYEPGSGSTIMSYAGSCGANNVVFSEDIYYHVRSLEQFIEFTREGDASGCATLIPTDNHEPEIINWPYTDGFTIPISTYFELDAEATDADGELLYYTWEQYNLGPAAQLGEPVGDGPAFRSAEPDGNTKRYFPRLPDILSNTSTVNEVLPTYSRNLNFRFVVRDKNPQAGAAVWREVAFKASETAGPFLVNHPNTSGVNWKVGDYTEVTWDVANTDNAIINCKKVNILLSTNGGNTFDVPLAMGVANDGSQFITVPDMVGNNCRVRVEAADNIFFDISNTAFQISPATEPTYTLIPSNTFVTGCVPDIVDIEFTTSNILNFDSLIALSIEGELPPGAVATFNMDSITPGQNTTLTVDMSQTTLTGSYGFTVVSIAAGDTSYRDISLDLIANDFSDFDLLTPVDGVTGIVLSTEFSWSDAINAESYEFEIATSPSFGTTIVGAGTNIGTTTFTPNVLLEENQLYYWRVRPVNSCGASDWSQTRVLHTVNAICTPSEAEDTPVNLGSQLGAIAESTIFVEVDGVISDINVPFLYANFQPVNSLTVTLVSPGGTEVKLFEENCGNTVNMILGFDDQAPLEITCPPDDGIVFQPVEPLAAFAGENSFGNWTLRVEVTASGFGASGGLNDWSLEFCADQQPNSPFLVTNQTLMVPPAQANTLTTSVLEAQDEDNAPQELRFTLVEAPAHGDLYLIDQPLQIGDHFRQSTINANNLVYLHNGGSETEDQFLFIVEDGTGGFIPVTPFSIVIDENAPVNTFEAGQELDKMLSLFPNPNTGQFQLNWEGPSSSALISLYSSTGQLLKQETTVLNTHTPLAYDNLSDGVYLLELLVEGQRINKRLIIVR